MSRPGCPKARPSKSCSRIVTTSPQRTGSSSMQRSRRAPGNLPTASSKTHTRSHVVLPRGREGGHFQARGTSESSAGEVIRWCALVVLVACAHPRPWRPPERSEDVDVTDSGVLVRYSPDGGAVATHTIRAREGVVRARGQALADATPSRLRRSDEGNRRAQLVLPRRSHPRRFHHAPVAGSRAARAIAAR